MSLRPYWQFYKDLFPFVISLGVLCALSFGALWGYVLFGTVGIAFGFIGFSVFRKEEYYFYYNLGITKRMLFTRVLIINLLVGLPVFTALLLLFLLIFGRVSIT